MTIAGIAVENGARMLGLSGEKMYKDAQRCELNPRIVLRGSYSQNSVPGTKNAHLVGSENSVDSEVGAHWFRASFPVEQLDDFVEYLEMFFGESTEEQWGRYNYDMCRLFAHNITVNYHSTPERTEKITDGKVCVDIPGEGLDTLDADMLAMFFYGFKLMKFNMSCTRLDIYFDDFKRVILPHKLLSVCEANGHCGFRKLKPDVEYNTKAGRLELIRDAFYFGRRGGLGSGAFLRAYDKGMECAAKGVERDTEGFNNAIRWELELSGDKAKIALASLINCDGNNESFAKICGGLLAGSIDFVHKTDKNLNRCKRHVFWQDILDRIDCIIKLRAPRKSGSYDRAKKWFGKQCTSTLAMMKKVMPARDFFQYIFAVAENELALKPRHLDMIRDYKKQLESRDEYKASLVRDFFKDNNIEFGYGDLKNG